MLEQLGLTCRRVEHPDHPNNYDYEITIPPRTPPARAARRRSRPQSAPARRPGGPSRGGRCPAAPGALAGQRVLPL